MLALSCEDGSDCSGGAAVASAVGSSRPRHGEHVCAAAAFAPGGDTLHVLLARLEKGVRPREAEEAICGGVLLVAAALAQGALPLLAGAQVPGAGATAGSEPTRAAAEAAVAPLAVSWDAAASHPRVDYASPAASLPADSLLHWRLPLAGAVQRLLGEECPASATVGGGAARWLPPVMHVLATSAAGASGETLSLVANAALAPAGGRALLVPGSFNPPHVGHLKLAAAAVAALARSEPSNAVPRAVFELSAANVDKPPLSAAEALRRTRLLLAAAGAGAALAVTRAPRIIDKAALFPGASFAVGYDTAARLVDPKYYGGSADAMLEELLALKRSGSRVLVAGRADAHAGGAFLSFDANLRPRLPAQLQSLFIEIPETDFRVDISSTQLRAAAAAAAASESPLGSAHPL